MPETSIDLDASKGPIMKATKYVDIGIVSSKHIFFNSSFCFSSTFFIAAFDTQNKFLLTTKEIEKIDLYSGSSKQGKALLASVDSNCVVAID